ncbi:MAG: alpha/beta fold hydrolase [Chloroflexota bacterium]
MEATVVDSIAEWVVFFILLFVIIQPVQAAWIFARPPRFRISFRTPTDWGVEYQSVQLEAPDGVMLTGWYVPSQNGAAVLLLHGHGGNRLAVSYHAEALISKGYGVLLFDLRAHGNSGGRRFALGEAAVRDVTTAVTYLSKQPEINAAGIGIYGISVGATLAIAAATRTVAIRAIVADGASPTVYTDMFPPETLWDRIYRLPIQRYYMFLRQRFGRVPALPPLTKSLRRLAPRPLLLISTGRGAEQRLGRHYYGMARAPKDAWELPEARHAAGWRKRPDAYAERLVTFFDAYLIQTHEVDPANLPVIQQPAFLVGENLPEDVAYDVTVALGWANLVAFVLLPVLGLLLWLPYQLLWGGAWAKTIDAIVNLPAVWLIVVVLVGVVVHELLHAAGFIWLGGVDRTAVSFGFSWRGLAPYAHCREPITAVAYRLTTALPGFVLGVLPALLGLLTDTMPLMLFGAWMIIAAGGDISVLLVTQGVPSDACVRDHPNRAGCYVLKEKNCE